MAGTEQTDPAVLVTAESGLSFKGLWMVLASPAEFFVKLKDQPKVLVPYVVFAIICAAFMYGTADLIVEMQMEAMRESGNPAAGQMSADMLRTMTLALGIPSMLLIPLITAVVAFFWGNFVFAGKAKFKQVLSVVLYGNLIYALGFLATWPLIIAKGSMTVDYSLAVLVTDQGFQSFAFQALSKIGVFYIWEFIVAAIGFSVIYGVSRNKGYLIAVLSLGLLSAIHVGMSALGQAFN